jgi:hypothetical protein
MIATRRLLTGHTSRATSGYSTTTPKGSGGAQRKRLATFIFAICISQMRTATATSTSSRRRPARQTCYLAVHLGNPSNVMCGSILLDGSVQVPTHPEQLSVPPSLPDIENSQLRMLGLGSSATALLDSRSRQPLRRELRSSPAGSRNTASSCAVQVARVNAIAERWVRSARSECLDRLIVFNEANFHVRQLL